MTDTSSIVSLSGIVKRFGSVTALHEISFDIARGEFFSLLGASGCGKTTLLRILAGVEQPSDGEILIDGQVMTRVPANRRPSNMVFQSYAIFPHLNVAENIGYGLRNMSLTRAEAADRVSEALRLVKLDGLGNRNAHQLSGGQRQRVALARALVCRPKVLLLDEPLSALDKNLRVEMQHELRALQRSVGITFVFVTHDQEEAMTLSDRIAVMSGGRVLQIDTPGGLYQRPNCREVAEFIGTMNLFAGLVVSGPGGVITVKSDVGGLMQGLPGDGTILPAQTPAFVALRPERIRISADIPTGVEPTNSLRGQVASVAYLGDRSHYRIAVPGLPVPVVVSASNAGAAGPAVAPGDAVQLSWDADAAIVLPQS